MTLWVLEDGGGRLVLIYISHFSRCGYQILRIILWEIVGNKDSQAKTRPKNLDSEHKVQQAVEQVLKVILMHNQV